LVILLCSHEIIFFLDYFTLINGGELVKMVTLLFLKDWIFMFLFCLILQVPFARLTIVKCAILEFSLTTNT